MSDEWSAFEEAAPAAPAPALVGDLDDLFPETLVEAMRKSGLEDEVLDRLSSLAESLLYAERELAECKECRTRVVTDIEGLIPETMEGTIKVPGWTITIERGERWSWDKDILEQMLKLKGINDPAEIPAFIKRSTTVNRAKFDAQPEDVRREWIAALTRQKGATKITVTPDDKYKYEEL